MGNDYTPKSHDLVKSSRKDLIVYSSFVSRGLVLANSIMGITKDNKDTFGPMEVLANGIVEESKVMRGYYPNGRLQWEATFRNGKREGASKAYFETVSFDFQMDEWGSLEKIKPLLAKLGQPTNKFVNIKDAVDWLNTSIEPYQMYIKYTETNKINQNIRKLLPRNFNSMLNYQLIYLTSTARGKELKREIISDLYPQEAPKKPEKVQLRSEVNYRDGKAEGVCKTYYDNGKLQSEMIFKNGEQEGVSKVYYENELPK